MRILIADDNAPVRHVVRQLLQRWSGFDISEAVDGQEAIEKAEKQKPDLIILDLSMPRMNGLDAARVLRAQMAHVPIILFTMYAEGVLSSQLTESGIDALVAKGDSAGLVSCIESMLRARFEKPAAPSLPASSN